MSRCTNLLAHSHSSVCVIIPTPYITLAKYMTQHSPKNMKATAHSRVHTNSDHLHFLDTFFLAKIRGVGWDLQCRIKSAEPCGFHFTFRDDWHN